MKIRGKLQNNVKNVNEKKSSEIAWNPTPISIIVKFQE